MIPVQQVLKDSQVSKHEVDEMVIFGGSTWLPKIQQLVRDLFNGKVPCKYINPDEAVAYGEAVECSVLSDDPDSLDIVLINVNSLTLGVETVGGVMNELISCNIRITTKKLKHLFHRQMIKNMFVFKFLKGNVPWQKITFLLVLLILLVYHKDLEEQFKLK